MKQILMAVLVVSILATTASALSLDFQSADQLTDIAVVDSSSYNFAYVRNGAGGNSYVTTRGGAAVEYLYFRNNASLTMTYAAVTQTGTAGATVWLFNSTSQVYRTSTYAPGAGRIEVVISGGYAYFYHNGILYETSTVLAQNPSYIGFGTYGVTSLAQFDNAIWGNIDDKHIQSVPEEGIYYIKQDFVDPANSGFYYFANDTLINSNTFTTTWGRSNASGQALLNESIYLIEVTSGTVYETHYTGTASYGTTTWTFSDSLIGAGAPYGVYQVKLNTSLSDRIPYIANGANINFDKSSYSSGDPFTLTCHVDTDYWIPSTYTYRIDVIDVYGTVHHTQNIVSSTGSVDFTWDSDADEQGVYYGEIIAQEIATGDDILMMYDYATLTATFGFNGYVNAAQTALTIEAANVSYAQGDITVTGSSGFDGNYSVSGFLTGLPVWANVSADGFENQNFTFTVMRGHTITRNITLNETAPSYTGLSIGGVCREGIFTDPNTITNGYGRPISLPECHLLNTTYSESYTTTGNNAGGYLFDESGSVFLTTGRVYDLWCSRSGYGNSPNYTVVAA